ncbi:MAG: DegT/DnrJ/EryC1/StrS family aminotransferase [Anaerolineaceae bacterium]|nr:DegT/DnrJ/EryC1/StrS family aminotransferase [Anaerolineaceae bacterium]
MKINIAKPVMGPEEKQAVMEVLDSGIITQGPRVKKFEDGFAAMCGVKHAIATTSGTTALHIALLAHGIGPGDEVITSAFTFIASSNSVLFVGARPVFVDIDPNTFNLDPAQIEAAITPETKAIIPVHLFGLMCEMDAIMAIAKKHNLIVIEDACQAHDATCKGKKAGSFGTGTFSFYPTKNMTAGEGGMITADDDQIDELCRVIRNHGMRRRYYHDMLGYNFRMSDIHAAIGLVQLGRLAGYNQSRQAHAAFLDANLKGVVTPSVPEGLEHVYHQYTIRIPDGKRDALAAYLNEQGIGTMIYYPVPIHKQTFYQEEYGYDQHLPETEKAADEVLSLPVHPLVTDDEMAHIVKSVNHFMGA